MAKFQFVYQNFGGVQLINFFSFTDNRGSFSKVFEKDLYEQSGINFNICETIISKSEKNVIRGLHFQSNNPQAKLISVVSGAVYDVIVDLRANSGTYKQWRGYELSAGANTALFVPKGFAHGFLALTDNVIVTYQCDSVYDRESDTGIRFDDPDIGVRWPVDDIGMTIHSERDMGLMSFKEYSREPMELH